MPAPDPRPLLLAFESLGCDCEFGLVQRAFGAEPLSLLRFAAIGREPLLAGLATGFAGVDDPAELDIVTDDATRPEYWTRHRRFGLRAHTFRYADETAPGALLGEQIRKLRFQRRRFLEILASGEKLFVLHERNRFAPHEARPILAALRAYGPNHLLYVTADAAAETGRVERLEAGLYWGRIARFGTDGVPENPEDWLALCAAAHSLWGASGGQGFCPLAMGARTDGAHPGGPNGASGPGPDSGEGQG